jgi:hypothetical protein
VQTLTVTGISAVTYDNFSPPLTVVGGTIPAVLSDSNLATYIQTDNTVAGIIELRLNVPSLPAGAVVAGIQFKLMRDTDVGSDNPNPFFVSAVVGYDASAGFHSLAIGPSFTPYMHNTLPPGFFEDTTTGWFTSFADGTHIKDIGTSDVKVTLFVYPGSVPTFLRLASIQTVWAYNMPPTAAVTGPPNPSLTSKPVVTWAYSDVDGDPQRAVRVICVPDDAVSTAYPFGFAGDTGFNPTGVASKSFDSGKVFTSATSMEVGSGLANGGTYWAYVQVYADPVVGVEQTSPWVGRQFTVSVTPPADPFLTVTTDSLNARVHLDVTESTPTAPHADRFDIERSEDDGVTWVPVRGATFNGLSNGTRNQGITGVGWDTADRPQFNFGNGITAYWFGVLDDYTSGATQTFVGQAAVGAQRAWRFEIDATGHLQFVWSTNGSSWTNTATSTVPVPTANGQQALFMVGANLNTNPYQIRFYTAAVFDDAVATQLGSSVTGTGPQIMFNSNQGIQIDGLDNHGINMMTGITYRVDIWNGSIQAVVQANFVGLAPNTTAFIDPYGNTWAQTASPYGWLSMHLSPYDYEATPNIVLRYRARAWRDDPPADVAVGGWVEGFATDVESLTIEDGTTSLTTAAGAPLEAVLLDETTGRYTLPALTWRVKDPLQPTVNYPVTVFEWDSAASKPATVTEGIEATKAVVTHGGSRGDRIQAKLRTLAAADYQRLLAALTSGRTLLIQGVLGRQWYVQPVEEISRRQILAQSQLGEVFPVRHAYEVGVTLVEVEAP